MFSFVNKEVRYPDNRVTATPIIVNHVHATSLQEMIKIMTIIPSVKPIKAFV